LGGARYGAKMHVPEVLNQLIDRSLVPIIRWLASSDIVERRLEKERDFWEESVTEYYLKILDNLHARLSSTLAHLSLMVAICLFLLDFAHGKPEYNLLGFFILINACIYVFLVLLSIRGLRSIGLDFDYQSFDEYKTSLKAEMVVKYSILQLVNSLTILGTIILGVSVAAGWALGLTIV
jgi:hypothetical protein